MLRTETVVRRIAWGATLRRWLTWALLACLVSVSEARPKPDPDRDRSAEVKRKRQAEERRREREKRIQECIDDRDGDPDADREICESEVP